MTIGGGGPDYDKLEEIFGDPVDKQKIVDDSQRERELALIRQERYTRQIMGTPEGREWMWEVIINAPLLLKNPYTRNADTYYVLGEQIQIRTTIKYLKALDIRLYQLMELEAHNRKNEEE